nr:interleukin-1 receptor-associated kinase 1 [Arenicola marina]
MDIKMDEIEEATRNFNEQFVIGRGGFGTVYKVMLKRIATTVAVKVLQQLSSHRKEFEHLLRYRHENIIPLYGFSMDEERFCLIYQYMPNGSLEDRLARKYDSVPLTWEQRHNILLGTARGLQFIHSAMDKPLLHGDIKSANVLLDKHFEAKIGDFGLAKVANSGGNFKYTHVSEVDPNAKVYGSKAYLPAEYLSGQHKLRKDTDVYSFGVVIFETCTGRMALDEQRPSGQKALTDVMSLHDEANTLTKLMDATVLAWPVQLWCLVVQLGIRCTAAKRTSRPAIERVTSLYRLLQADLFCLTFLYIYVES